MRIVILSLLAGCTQSGPSRVDAAPDSAAREIGFELAGPGGAALVVPVTVNGRGPYQFVLDTGATLTCIDQEVSASLQLPETRGVIGTGAGVSGAGRVSLVDIDSLQIGQTTVHGIRACVLDLQHLETAGLEMDGLLGLNVLKEFRVTLDFSRAVLRLDP